MQKKNIKNNIYICIYAYIQKNIKQKKTYDSALEHIFKF